MSGPAPLALPNQRVWGGSAQRIRIKNYCALMHLSPESTLTGNLT